MTDHKFTGKEIIKALECCSDGTGKNIIKAVLDLINRQKAEIEEQHQAIINALKRMGEIRSEAYKEFAERLKALKIKPEFPWDDFVVTEGAIDDLVKEMTEGHNESQNT